MALASFLSLLMKRFLCSLLLLGSALPGQAAALQCGEASFYGGHGDGYAWQTMANGRPMNPQAMIAAHPWLPFGTKLLVKNRDNGKQVVLTVADRGPWHGGRIIDLSLGAFSRIARPSQGVTNVCISKL
jgi:rare lipoprotein A